MRTNHQYPSHSSPTEAMQRSAPWGGEVQAGSSNRNRNKRAQQTRSHPYLAMRGQRAGSRYDVVVWPVDTWKAGRSPRRVASLPITFASIDDTSILATKPRNYPFCLFYVVDYMIITWSVLF